MMHPLHDYLAKQLADRLGGRRVVVWYDPRREFVPFFDEVRGGPRTAGVATRVKIGGVGAHLAEYDGSMFELRAIAEPLVAGDVPSKTVLYMPGLEPDRRGSVLMELELAGERYQPTLMQMARNVLRQRYTEGVIDELTGRPGIGYAELADAASGAEHAEPPSILKGLFRKARDGDGQIAEWLANTAHDDAITAKGATDELIKLVRSRLGLALPADAPIAKLRAVTLRYVLGNEFRLDLSGAAPASLDSIPVAKNGFRDRVRDCAQRLRADFGDAYAELADRVEDELSLRQATIVAAQLGGIDTFRFEERALLGWCGELIARDRFDDASAVVAQREHSYWLDRDVGRKAQWEACRRMAELGRVAATVRAGVVAMTGPVNAWIDAYAHRDGWHRLDLAQRRLETWLTQLDEHCAEAPLAVVRGAYEEACRLMAEGFTKALVKAHWTTTGVMHQTRVYEDAVAPRPRPVAYVLVDAMRFEMGVELVGRLPHSSEVSIRPAVVALPSITPVGMSALMPGAAASYSVVEQGGKLGGRIDDAFLPDVAARKKHAAARLPDLADMTLDEVLTWKPSRLAERVAGKQIVIVRSQEIDHAGEAGFVVQARQVMSTVIDNLSRALRRLAVAGIEHAVISADHGHLFASDRDPSLRIDAPGGATVELHRRCWIGRGGTTPAGCVRVAASALGYDADLDLVFPTGAGVFKAGGDLAFHHGGPSLQEMIVPVVTVKTKIAGGAATTAAAGPITVTNLPAVVTARALSAAFQLGGANLALFANPMTVRPLLMSGGKQVGAAGMAVETALVEGCVTLEPRKPVTVAFLLADPGVTSLRIVVQDPATDAELYQSPEIPVRLGM